VTMLPSFSRGWPRTISTGGRLMESAIGGEGAGQTWREQGRRRWVPHPPGSTKSQHPPRANARQRLIIGRGATKPAAEMGWNPRGWRRWRLARRERWYGEWAGKVASRLAALGIASADRDMRSLNFESESGDAGCSVRQSRHDGCGRGLRCGGIGNRNCGPEFGGAGKSVRRT